MTDRTITITLDAAKARQGVPVEFAARYAERKIRAKKGKGSFRRQKGGDE